MNFSIFYMTFIYACECEAVFKALDLAELLNKGVIFLLLSVKTHRIVNDFQLQYYGSFRQSSQILFP